MPKVGVSNRRKRFQAPAPALAPRTERHRAALSGGPRKLFRGPLGSPAAERSRIVSRLNDIPTTVLPVIGLATSLHIEFHFFRRPRLHDHMDRVCKRSVARNGDDLEVSMELHPLQSCARPALSAWRIPDRPCAPTSPCVSVHLFRPSHASPLVQNPRCRRRRCGRSRAASSRIHVGSVVGFPVASTPPWCFVRLQWPGCSAAGD